MPRLPVPRTRLGRVLAAFALMSFLIYGLLGGCGAQRLPPSLTSAERAALDARPLPYKVVVIPWDSATTAQRHQNPTAYADRTMQWLRGSKAFASVTLGARPNVGDDLIATPTGAYCNTAIIPLWTIISLGLFPTVFTDTDCEGAVFRRAGGRLPGDSVVIQDVDSARVVMGWVAVPLGALPGWTHGAARDNSRAQERRRLWILTHQAALAALVGR